MTEALTAIYLIIVLGTAIKMSLMSIRASLIVCLWWGVFAAVLTYLMSGFSASEIAAYLNVKRIIAAEFIELFVWLWYVFAPANRCQVVTRYPGLVICAPIMALAANALRTFTGVDFGVLAITSGVVVSAALMACVLLCRKLRVDQNVLYILTLVGVILCVVTYSLS